MLGQSKKFVVTGVLAVTLSLSLSTSFAANEIQSAQHNNKVNTEQYLDFAKKVEQQSIPTDKDKKEVLALNKKVVLKAEKYQKELLRDVAKQTDQEIKLLIENNDANNFNKTQGFGSIKKDRKSFKTKEIYVFISTSLKERNLLSLAKEAKKYGASLIMRGFVDNSYIKTAETLQNIIEKTGRGVSIDPELFKQFEVTEVPTFVVMAKDADANCVAGVACNILYDKISGNISLEDALSKIEAKGEVLIKENISENPPTDKATKSPLVKFRAVEAYQEYSCEKVL